MKDSGRLIWLLTGLLLGVVGAGMYLGQANECLDHPASQCLVQELVRLPGKLEAVLSHDPHYEALGKELHRATDFLYGQVFLDYQTKGNLHKLDLAFSRDQPQKIYVQHRMLENAKELWSWLQGGAYFYVCGDAKSMAKDVHQTLIDIAHQQGGFTAEAALAYVNQTLMRTEKRYLRDVY